VTMAMDSDQRLSSHSAEAPDADSRGAEIVAVLDNIDVPIVVVRRDCTLARINRAATTAFGLAPSDVGRRLKDIAALGDVEDIEKFCAQAFVDDAPVRRDIRTGDRRFLLRVAPYAIGAGETSGAVLTFTNVTAFRASLEQAIYEREYTKAILNTVASPLVVLDADLCVQSGNRAFYSMFGVSREKAQGIPLKNLGDSDWKASGPWAALNAILADSTEFVPVELQRDFPAIGQRIILLDARRVPLQGAATILLSVQDITEQKRTEEELQTAGRRKDEFLALLAHELRNPLAPIRTGLELIRLSGDTPESVRRVRSIMQRQVGQMVRLIDDLLDVSRISSGKIVLQRTSTPLVELVQTAIEEQRTAIEASKIELTIELPQQNYLVDVDPARFVQILSNVLHNASKFTPAHGKVRCFVEALTDADGDRIAITISDTGIGISQDMLPRVFEMFTQAHPATNRSHGGLGIGLALARRLAQMHGGDIVARSDGPGRGSAFTITMPLCNAVDAQASMRRLDVPKNVTCRVLVIDDNQDAANTMAMLVGELGCSTSIAHDAASGLQAIEKFRPDIVFLDIGMPGVNGYETCRRMRQLPSQQGIMIVAITGWGQPQDKQRALDAGFDEHLTKPVDLEALTRIFSQRVRSGVATAND
jgi:two-component system, chemotaxis family, CheB/CheR fusion protein